MWVWFLIVVPMEENTWSSKEEEEEVEEKIRSDQVFDLFWVLYLFLFMCFFGAWKWRVGWEELKSGERKNKKAQSPINS